MTENYGLLIGLKERTGIKSPRKLIGRAFRPLLASLALVTVLCWWSDRVACQKPVATRPSEADYEMAKHLFHSARNPQDSAKAAALITQAAQEGDPKAQTAMAILCLKGLGVRPDATAGVNWLRKAVAQDCAAAQNELGVLYALGKAVPQDLAEATRLCGLAAHRGNKAAKQNLLLLAAARRDARISLADLERSSCRDVAVQRYDSDGVMVTYKPSQGGVGLAKIKSDTSSEPLRQLCGILNERSASPFTSWTSRTPLSSTLGAL